MGRLLFPSQCSLSNGLETGEKEEWNVRPVIYIYLRNIYKAPYRAAVPSLFLFARTDTVIQTESVRPAVDTIFPFVYILVVDIYIYTHREFQRSKYTRKRRAAETIFRFPAGAQHHVAWCTECGAKGHIISLYFFFFFFVLFLFSMSLDRNRTTPPSQSSLYMEDSTHFDCV